MIDGTGNAWFYGDVGVAKDRISWVGPAGSLAKAKAGQRIDAKGMVVAPGFIDIQSGSYDNFLVGDGRSLSKVTQGVTTEIMGEAYTLAPWNDSLASFVPFFFLDEDTTAARAALKGFGGPHGFGAWLQAMERHGNSVNVGSFVGATTLRTYVMGQAAGAANPAQLDSMRAIMRGAMEDGAFGLGTALIYPPGNYASTEELIEVAKAMSPYHGVYITHMRSEADHFLEAMDEAIRIGREGGVPVEIYHLKAAGKRNWGKAREAIAKIDSARAAGQDVSADMYPYTAGGTALAACLPPWASEDGKLLERLADPATRAKIKAAVLEEQSADWENLCQLATPEGVHVGDFKEQKNKKFENKSLAEIARARNQDWADALIDLTLEEKAAPRRRVLSDVGRQRRAAAAPAVDQVRHRRRRRRSGEHPRQRDSSPGLRHVSQDPGPLRARAPGDAAGGCGAQDVVGGGRPAVAPGSRLGAGGDVRRPGGVRSGDGDRPRHLREVAPALDRDQGRAGERSAGGAGGETHRRQAGESGAGAGISSVAPLALGRD